jgi:6-phosphogluconolactonase
VTDRRTFISMLAGAAAAPRFAMAQSGAGKLVVYASVGPELRWYDASVSDATLEQRGSVRLPANVQYAWPHVSRRYLYATSSDSASGLGGFVGKTHHASALRVEAASGALALHGDPVPLATRPIHNSTDRRSQYLLTAYNNPSGVTVHRINADGTIGAEVQQPAPIDAGIFAHQALVTPDNRLAIIVARGNQPEKGKPEDPGALKVYRFNEGVLSDGATIAPNGGYGFGPRHLDFHPTQPWIYVSLERQNQLTLFRRTGDSLGSGPVYSKDLLGEPHNVRPRQLGGTVHIHPNGRFVYGINRADHTVDYNGRRVFGGGENSLVAYSIEPSTGEPMLLQRIDTRGFHPRTFHIDPSGRLLVAAHIEALDVRDGDSVQHVPARLSTFRVRDDGRLDYVRSYDVDVGKAFMWWMGMLQL